MIKGTNPRVILEPELEIEVQYMKPAILRAMAEKFYRWAKTLWRFADAMEFKGAKSGEDVVFPSLAQSVERPSKG